MALAAFDTLESVDELEKAGVPEKQARAISIVVRKAHGSSDVATKADLEKLGTELRHEMKALELCLTGEMKLLKWILGFIAAGVASLVLKAFF